MKRISIAAFVLLVVGTALAAQYSIGEITYLEGYPEVIRDGDILYDTLDFGFPIQNFDSIRTDESSFVELRLDPSTGIDASISVDPHTHFYVSVSNLRSEQTGSVELLSGTISVVAREFAGRSRLQVRTQSSVAGVRGTTFTVTTALGGEVLISTQEGLVEVIDEQGFALFAAPGEAVEVDTERNVIRNLKYHSDAVDEFRRQWVDDRVDAFRANAPRVLRFYCRRYLGAHDQFIQAYEELMSYRTIIDRWIEESRRGITGSDMSLVQDKRRIAGSLLRVRASMFVFEHTIDRLGQMAAYVRDISAAVAVGDVGDGGSGGSAADLYRRIEIERTVMRQRLATVRHILKLYAERNDGETPMDVFGGFTGVDTNDDFFGDSGDPGAEDGDFFGDGGFFGDTESEDDR